MLVEVLRLRSSALRDDSLSSRQLKMKLPSCFRADRFGGSWSDLLKRFLKPGIVSDDLMVGDN